MSWKEVTAWTVGILSIGWLMGAAVMTGQIQASDMQHTQFIIGDLKLPEYQVDCSSVVFNAEDICGIGQIQKTKQNYCLFCIIVNVLQGKEFHYFGSMDLTQVVILRQDFVNKMARWMEWKDKQPKQLSVNTEEVEDTGSMDTTELEDTVETN
jgi:hypothetical protein